MMFSAWRMGHSVRNVGEKPAMCGVTMQFGSSRSGSWLSTGSISVTSSAAASSWPALSAAASAVPLMMGAAGGVHQERGGLELTEGVGVEQVAGLRGCGAVDGDVVGAAQQILEVHQLDAVEIHAQGVGIGRQGIRGLGIETMPGTPPPISLERSPHDGPIGTAKPPFLLKNPAGVSR